MTPLTYYVLVLSVVGTLVNLIPCVYPAPKFDRGNAEEMRGLLQSDFYVRLIEFAFTIVVPMLVDVLSYYLHKDSFYYYERVILLMACPTPHCILFGLSRMPDIASIFAAWFCNQSIWISGPLVSGILQSKVIGWSALRVKVVFTMFMFAHLSPLYSVPGAGSGLRTLCGLSYLASYIIFTVSMIRYLISLWYHRNDRNELPSTEHLPLLCVLMLWFYQTFIIIAMSTWGHDFGFFTVSEGLLAYLVVMSAAVCSICTILPGKIARAQANEVQSVLEMKKSFVRYIGHEIRTPLNVASIGLDLLNSSLSDVLTKQLQERMKSRSGKWCGTGDELATPATNTTLSTARYSPANSGREHEDVVSDAAHILDEVRRALVMGTSVLNDLLLYDKLDSSNLKLESTNINVANFVTATLELFVFQASASNINFVVDIENDLPALFGDQHKLRHVLCNLASNALKFTPAEGTITCTVTKIQNGIQIQFKDTGIGIAKENLPKVFKSIIQFDANVNQDGKGTGLGLYITRGLVESHGGSVSVHSDGLGTGCTFSVILPAKNASNASSGGEVYKSMSSWVNGAYKAVRSKNRWAAPKIAAEAHDMTRYIDDTNLDKLESNDSYKVQVYPVSGVGDKTNVDCDCKLATIENAVEKRNTSMSIRLDVAPVPTLAQLQKQKWLAGFTALIVDDSVSSVKMLKLLLNRVGCTCVYAVDGLEAVNTMRSLLSASNTPVDASADEKDGSLNVAPRKIDFVLLDNFMPNMNGPDACVEIRRLGYDGPVIGLTGHALNDDIEGFKASGANKVLSKPLDLTLLYADLSDLLPLLKVVS
jgi:signal transduction histidine kinase